MSGDDRVRRSGQCWELGPYGTRCTEPSTHRYAHYDASEDSSFTDDWRDWFDDDNQAALNG